jgi:hypothetical protein
MKVYYIIRFNLIISYTNYIYNIGIDRKERLLNHIKLLFSNLNANNCSFSFETIMKKG